MDEQRLLTPREAESVVQERIEQFGLGALPPVSVSTVADGGWWVVWPHDWKTPVARLQRHPKRGFEVVDRRERL